MDPDLTDETGGKTTSRRRFVAALGALGVTGLAGCGGDDDTDTATDTPPDTTEPGTTTAPDTTEPGTTTAPGGTDTETPTPTDTGTPTDTPPQQDIPEDGPSIISFSGGGSVSPGESTTLTGTVQNPYLFPIRNIQVELSAPNADWSVTAEGETTIDQLDTQDTAEITWEITAPSGASGEVTITGSVSFESTSDSATSDVSRSVFVFSPGDVPQEGLEAYYPLDGDAPTNVVTGTDADVTGDPTTDASGVVDGAWEFTTDGSRSSTADALTSGEDLPLNGEGATVAAWINYTSHEPFARIYQVGGDTATPAVAQAGYEVLFTSESDDVYIYGDGTTQSATNRPTIGLSPDTWLFVVTVVDGSDFRIHTFDESGELDASPLTGTAQRTQSGTNPLVLFSGDDSEPAGRLDEVRAYSRALSESEVVQLYSGSGGSSDGN